MTPDAAVTVSTCAAGLGDAFADVLPDEQHPAHKTSNQKSSDVADARLYLIPPVYRALPIRIEHLL
jgi:hypothetical protein